MLLEPSWCADVWDTVVRKWSFCHGFVMVRPPLGTPINPISHQTVKQEMPGITELTCCKYYLIVLFYYYFFKAGACLLQPSASSSMVFWSFWHHLWYSMRFTSYQWKAKYDWISRSAFGKRSWKTLINTPKVRGSLASRWKCFLKE